MIHDRKAQAAVWGLLILLIFLAISGGLVDIYHLVACRNWAYSVAQEAALAGAANGRDWDAFIATGEMSLDSPVAQSQAEQIILAEMTGRGITGFTMDVRVLPDPDGGSLQDYPPQPVRLGSSLGSWSASEPAVGVYLAVPVDWMLLDWLDLSSKSVSVFASAGISQ